VNFSQGGTVDSVVSADIHDFQEWHSITLM
jgi:hypothetical protein